MGHLFKKGFFFVLEDFLRHTKDRGLKEIGYFPNKPFTLNYECPTVNFSVILSGKGFYEVNGITYRVEAPCVLVQLPGQKYHYGPEAGQNWEEMYFIYDQRQLSRLFDNAWLDPKIAVRKINNRYSVSDAIIELKKAAETTRPCDIIEQLSERVILETLMPAPVNEDDELVAKLRDIALSLKTNHQHTVMFEKIADDLNISYSTFRRIWYELFGTSPKNYQKKHRLTEAARLLLSSNLSVHRVGQRLGFDDPAYFSRIFRNYVGCSPSEYRRRQAWVVGPEYQNNNKIMHCEQETEIQRDNLLLEEA
ncbi:AraC family transcriptional regulator [Alginatibacterium sediminis]|uniref:AraC family transcriptional regulator n=1 Tax=Alginatibacterium sediminis TaxID=2164068 RepID=A0A420EGF1_9ALTE|nr:AraC family transcriptional regulator [Alginatibacterium sediminis]RKF19791.1 AraC family transcriptional regulator [Alginatibacterium sediminis]